MKKTITLGLNYNEFTQGLKDCDMRMKELDSEFKKSSAEMGNSASSSEKLQNKISTLNSKIEVQSQKVEIARQKLLALKNDSNASASAISKATIEFNNQSATLANMQNELTAANTSQLNLMATMTIMIGICSNLANSIKEIAVAAAEYGDEMSTLSQQTGLALDTLQGWDYASELIDTSLDAMVGGFTKVEKAMANKPALFEQLGVAITNSNGSMRNAYDVYMDSIDALGRVQNATEQDQLAMEIFGKSAMEMTGMINAGSEGLKGYVLESQEMGALTNEQINNLSMLSDEFEQLNSKMEYAKASIGAALAPALISIANVIEKIPTPALAAGIAITTVAVAVGSLAIASTLLSGTFASLIPTIVTATATLAPYLAIILLVVAAVTALIAIINAVIDKYREWKKAQDEVTESASKISNMFTGGNTNRASSYLGGVAGSNAKGTNYWRGGQTWVGENGAELIDLPIGTRIYNNSDSRNMSSPTNIYNITIDAKSVDSFNKVVNVFSGLEQGFNRGGFVNG